MTVKRDKALLNALASSKMEGLPVSKQTELDCIRYLEGQVDADTLVNEILQRCRNPYTVQKG